MSSPAALRAAERIAASYRSSVNGIAWQQAEVFMAQIIDAEFAAERAELIEALEECADWLCDAQPHSDPWERGQKARKALASLTPQS